MTRKAILMTVLAMAWGPLLAAKDPRKNTDLAKEVHHELVMLPYSGVFDQLSYRVDGTKVALFGQVTRPTLKSDAGNVAKQIEGGTAVDNEIEVLPLSPNDDRGRMAACRAIYSQAPPWRYQLRAVPPIHIIVKDGNVTLVGVVFSQRDKTLAEIGAEEVPGSFTVTNHLQVEK